MKVIGITGGVGSGKSTVMRLLEEITDSYIIMADDVAKSLYEPGSSMVKDIRDAFGEECMAKDGSIDKQVLAGIIFFDESRRTELNAMVHPKVKSAIEDKIRQLKESGRYDYVFVEAALFFEAHFDEFCDEVWFVRADESVRRRRLQSDRGYDNAKIDSIMAAQCRDEEFADRCDWIIDNSGDVEDTRREILCKHNRVCTF